MPCGPFQPDCRNHMGFTPVSAPAGARAGLSRAADSLPDRFTLMSLLRAAAPGLGLRAPVLATLDAMLSCLPPQRRHHVVFAANATLLARIGGTCERTLRRHAARLIAAGLIRRRDSANGKRFARRAGGEMAAFGFDLEPLFDRVAELAQLAAEARAGAERIALLRCRLRAAVQARLAADPADAPALAALPCLRRKLDEEALSALCDQLAAPPALPVDTPHETPVPAASDGRNVRHHQKSETESIDEDAVNITLPTLLAACPEAAQFAVEPVAHLDQAVRHARMLAPMIGIDARSYDSAESSLGRVPAALTIWLILQLGQKVRSAGAYFRALTSGRRRAGFDPAQVITRMAAGLSADNTAKRWAPA